MTKVDFEHQDQIVLDTFNADPDDYARVYEQETPEAYSMSIRRQRVYEMAEGEPLDRVLDIGCGPGVTVEHFLKKGSEIHGIDIAENMIRACRERFGDSPRTHFSVGKIEEIDSPEGHFDLVICMGVVEYLKDDDVPLREMFRVLRPGGAAIVTCPNFWSPWNRWSALYWGAKNMIKRPLGLTIYQQMFHRQYRRDAYSRRAEAAGFAVEECVYYNFKVLLEPLSRWFPATTVAVARKLDALRRGPMGWLGTGFIVKLRKPPVDAPGRQTE
jgi:ubiquinone/menaquinone biosynthesis C-methylase UbiE